MPSTTLDRSEFDSIPDTIKAFRTYKSHATQASLARAHTCKTLEDISLYQDKAVVLTLSPRWQAMASS